MRKTAEKKFCSFSPRLFVDFDEKAAHGHPCDETAVAVLLGTPKLSPPPCFLAAPTFSAAGRGILIAPWPSGEACDGRRRRRGARVEQASPWGGQE